MLETTNQVDHNVFSKTRDFLNINCLQPFLQKYHISFRAINLIIDASSFTKTKILKSVLDFPSILFEGLNDEDLFGLTVIQREGKTYLSE